MTYMKKNCNNHFCEEGDVMNVHYVNIVFVACIMRRKYVNLYKKKDLAHLVCSRVCLADLV
jgi:hypothetical protein